ncbi:MAG: hypothetical protein FJW40_17330 [Acidobacteria bacterium]|nr:hypothetical protein [Acidobacteriota bacterium]
MKYRSLCPGIPSVSELSFGAAPLGDVYGALTLEECRQTVHFALDQGINLFDTSPYYGLTLSEERLGACLEGRRHEAVISTKCGRYGHRDFDFTAARIRRSVDESLARLRTDYIDLLIAHDVEFGDLRLILDETFPALHELKREGKIRAVGVSGLPLNVLRYVAREGRADVILSYCHYNLLMDDLDTEIRPLAQERGIGLINASPLHMGVLSEGGPQPWHLAEEAVKQAGRAIAALCAGRGFAVSAVALRYALDYPHAATTLCGMKSVAEVRANLAAMAAPVDPGLLAEIRGLAAPVLNRIWPEGRPENRVDSIL